MHTTKETEAPEDELTVEVIENFKLLGAVAPGTYNVKVEEAFWTKTRKGDPMLKLRMTVEGGPFDGSTLWDQGTDAPQAWRFFFPKLAAFGISEALYHEVTSKQVAKKITGQRTEVETDIRWYGERIFTSVKSYTS